MFFNIMNTISRKLDGTSHRHPKWCESRCNLTFSGASHARFVAHRSNFIITRKSHKIDHFLELLNISGDFWQFRAELARLSNSIHTRKSHKIDQFLEILNISDDSWQFRAEVTHRSNSIYTRKVRFEVLSRRLSFSVVNQEGNFRSRASHCHVLSFYVVNQEGNCRSCRAGCHFR